MAMDGHSHVCGRSLFFRRDDVKKTSRHLAATVSFGLLGTAMGILDEGKRRLARALRVDRGVMKFVASQNSIFRAQGMRLGKAGLPVAEMELAFGKTKGRAKQARYPMRVPRLIG